MRYDLLITEIKNDNSRKILAHQLARDPGVSFQDALGKLRKLPVTLFRDLDEQTMAQQAGQYLKYGVRLKAVPAQDPPKPVPAAPIIPHPGSEPPVDSPQRTDVSKNVTKTMKYVAFPKDTELRAGIPESVSVNELGKNEEKKRKHEQLILISFLVLFIIIPLVMFLFSSGNSGKRQIVVSGIRGGQDTNHVVEPLNSTSGGRTQTSQISKRKSVTTADKKTSASMCDSAENASRRDISKMINFYKIAISFNKYNLDAWFGLLAAYKSAGMGVEYQQAANQMKELFGNDVLEVSSQVRRFGTVGDMYISDAGVLTMNVNMDKANAEVLKERVFSMIKILHSNYNYKSISIVVGDKKKDRMVVHVRPGMKIATFADFKKNASVIVFDK